MTGTHDAALVGQLRAAATRFADVDLVVLYGSRAGGAVRPASDVDVAIRAHGVSHRRKREIEVAFFRTSSHRVDVVFLDEAPPLLRFEVARTGRLVFERTAGIWTRERVRAMVDWWDWAPIARRLHAAAVSRLRKDASRW
jgi:uncharacterized protein